MIGESIFKSVQQEGKEDCSLDELLKIVEQEGLTKPERTKEVTGQQRENIRQSRQQMSQPEYELNSELVELGYNGFINVRGKVEELAQTQSEVETAVRARSTVYRVIGYAKRYVDHHLGKEREEQTVDSIIEKRSELMAELHDAIKESEDYSVQLLEMLRSYKIEHVTEQLLAATSYHGTLEKEKIKVNSLFRSVKKHIQRLTPRDDGYKALLTAEETLRVMSQYVDSELSKTKMDIVFKKDQTGNISVLEEMIFLGVECCDTISTNMANIRETMQYTIPALHLIQEQGAIVSISARATDPATEYIMLNVQKTKQTMQEMAKLAVKIRQKGSLPGMLVDLLDNYAGGIGRTARISSKKIEAEANKILTQPGYTT